ncbi:MAG: AAC(3) family N-acetyltransferase [Woeseiaceae bacterium]|nr:AAC(3) family N-acetyltransferase [Woeseiaceae bacterium]
MASPNTVDSLANDLVRLGLEPGMIVMVHSALGQVGYTDGGPAALIRALLDVLGDDGTLVMPCESPQALQADGAGDPGSLVFDPAHTPTTLGTVPEAFRTWPGTLRSGHPLVSVCANGRDAAEVTREHALPFGEGAGTPFEKLYTLDAHTLLIGVGFNRCTSLHYAESLTPNRRTTTHRYPLLENGELVWVEHPDMATDDGEHFPQVGERFMATGSVVDGKIGSARSLLFRTRELVDFAAEYFREALR